MTFALPSGRPAIMGILNVTLDSFSDGGQFVTLDRALDHALKLTEQGADFIDVGGESTRPGAHPVDESQESARVIPVVRALVKKGIAVSVDTRKPEVARQALAEGAQVVNDVSGLRDPQMIELCAATNCAVCIMHMKGEPQSMQQNPTYENVVDEVLLELSSAIERAESGGIEPRNIWIDPGIGFGKTLAHNLEILRNLERFTLTDYPVMIGVSRKSFLGKITETEDPRDREEGTLAAQVIAQMKGAKILRTHNVQAAVRTARTVAAILG